MWSAVGNVSFDDWLMLTWSFGWIGVLPPRLPVASSLARPAITSLTFMFDWVPEPVCQTRSGNSAASVPSATSPAARTIRSRCSAGSRPRSAFTSAAARLRIAEGVDDRDRHGVVADREMMERTLRLGAPVVVGRDVDRAHGVGLCSGGAGGGVGVDGGHPGFPRVRRARVQRTPDDDEPERSRMAPGLPVDVLIQILTSPRGRGGSIRVAADERP